MVDNIIKNGNKWHQAMQLEGKEKKLHEVRAMQLKGTKNNHNRQTRHLNYIKKNYFFILKWYR